MYSTDSTKRLRADATGLCSCGCGQRTERYQYDRPSDGIFRGRPRAFVDGHHLRPFQVSGEGNPFWKGGRTHRGGYIVVKCHGHPRADENGYVYEHVLIAERVLGKFLPVGCDVHHVDGEKQNNVPSNFVICQDQAYHKLLHKRQRAFEACGDPGALPCQICRSYERQDEMARYHSKYNGLVGRHRSCEAASRLRRKTQKGADVGAAA